MRAENFIAQQQYSCLHILKNKNLYDREIRKKQTDFASNHQLYFFSSFGFSITVIFKNEKRSNNSKLNARMNFNIYGMAHTEQRSQKKFIN